MKTNKGKIIVGTLAVGTAAVLYKMLNKSSGAKAEIISDTPKSTFPLKQGSRGPEVATLQKVLLAKGGQIARYIEITGGSDGIWGPGTEKAVQGAGFPSVMDQATYAKIVGGGSSNSISTTSATTSTPGFPLKMGSKGDLVKALQKALLAKGGSVAAHIKLSGGADGNWGPGTQRAVQSAGLPVVITEAQWKKIVGSNTTTIASFIQSGARGRFI